MKRPVRILLWIVSGAGAVILVILVTGYQDNVKRMRQAASEQRQCNARLAQLKRDLSIGMSREAVLVYLHDHRDSITQFLGGGDTLSVDLGRVQSNEWFCSFFEDYAELTFEGDTSTNPVRESLKSIKATSTGECL